MTALRQERRPPAVARVLERVTATARREAMFLPGSTVLVAVSGGPDSVCLLHALYRLRRLLRIRPVAFHFDHGLRPGSDRDAAYARAQAGRLGLSFMLRRAASGPARGESVEAWARTVRYRALAEVREEIGATSAAVGHTADDQAETVLLALLRGGGLDAVAAMRPVSAPIVRPLLDVTRLETEAFCRSLRLRPRQDPMNEDPAYMRAALRHRVIPELEAALGRSVREPLARTASLLREDAELLDALAHRAEADAVVRQTSRRDGSATTALRVDALDPLPRPIAGRVVRRALLSVGLVPTAAHVESILELARRSPGRRLMLPGGLVARREREYVSLSPTRTR